MVTRLEHIPSGYKGAHATTVTHYSCAPPNPPRPRPTCTDWGGGGCADPDALSGPLLEPAEMPSGCRAEQWARLVALRDARVSLETDTAQLTNTVQLLSDQLEVLQEEEARLVAQLESTEKVHCYMARASSLPS